MLEPPTLALAEPEGPGHLIDCPGRLVGLITILARRGQQPFHGEFGRGLEIQLEPVGGAGPAVMGLQGLEMEIGDRRRGQERRLDLEDPAIGKKATDCRKQLRPEAQRLGRSGWFPITGHSAIIPFRRRRTNRG